MGYWDRMFDQECPDCHGRIDWIVNVAAGTKRGPAPCRQCKQLFVLSGDFTSTIIQRASEKEKVAAFGEGNKSKQPTAAELLADYDDEA